MSDMKMQILKTISEALPNMTEQEKEKLLAFSEGMAFFVSSQAVAERNSA